MLFPNMMFIFSYLAPFFKYGGRYEKNSDFDIFSNIIHKVRYFIKSFRVELNELLTNIFQFLSMYASQLIDYRKDYVN